MIKQATKRELIRQAIAELADANGVVTAQSVFEAARSPNSILHGEFVWDGDKAIVELGMQRAAELIRSVRVEVIIDTHKVVAPYYVNHPSTSRSGEYMPVKTAADDDVIKHGILINEISRIEAAINRARALAGIFSLESEFAKMMEAVNDAKARIKVAA
jgi:hypothetical protein